MRYASTMAAKPAEEDRRREPSRSGRLDAEAEPEDHDGGLDEPLGAGARDQGVN